jgi:hypothetical protein
MHYFPLSYRALAGFFTALFLFTAGEARADVDFAAEIFINGSSTATPLTSYINNGTINPTGDGSMMIMITDTLSPSGLGGLSVMLMGTPTSQFKIEVTQFNSVTPFSQIFLSTGFTGPYSSAEMYYNANNVEYGTSTPLASSSTLTSFTTTPGSDFSYTLVINGNAGGLNPSINVGGTFTLPEPNGILMTLMGLPLIGLPLLAFQIRKRRNPACFAVAGS